jgi:gamma-glutamyltranspeptidase/glutathione hydrolase
MMYYINNNWHTTLRRNINFLFSPLICLIVFWILSIVPLPAQAINPYVYTIPKSATANSGMIVSAHPLASAAGVEILRRGGNAVDAAIAVQFALAVVLPEAGNIGGGGFLVAVMSDGKKLAIDFREKAPGSSSRNMYLDHQGNPVEGSSWYGAFSAGVPGSVDGMMLAHQYGKLPLKDLIEPAIRLAGQGFAITDAEARSLNNSRIDFLKYNRMPTAFTRKEKWIGGDTLLQPELASTLEKIRDQGRAGFYEGPVARSIVASSSRNGGIISEIDLKEYKAVMREAVEFPYRGFEVITMPLPASGGVLLPQMLGMAEMFPLHTMGFHTPASVHLMAEIERRAYADRARYLGDPDFVNVPVRELISKKYLAERMKDFSPLHAGNSKSIEAGIIPESTETTHFSIIDKDGNAVAVTTTLNGGYGSCHVVEGAGFLLNNEMDDFSIKPGVPNAYGAVGAEANAIVPGKRMLSSMTPTIMLKGKKVFLIAGTPGGTTITTSVFQTIVNIVDFNLSLEQAINTPKFHHQWLPDQIRVERDFPEELIRELEKLGHTVKPGGPIGRTDGIIVLPDGSFYGVGDKRGDDAAMGY